jgi:hypothetical protein
MTHEAADSAVSGDAVLEVSALLSPSAAPAVLPAASSACGKRLDSEAVAFTRRFLQVRRQPLAIARSYERKAGKLIAQSLQQWRTQPVFATVAAPGLSCEQAAEGALSQPHHELARCRNRVSSVSWSAACTATCTCCTAQQASPPTFILGTEPSLLFGSMEPLGPVVTFAVGDLY